MKITNEILQKIHEMSKYYYNNGTSSEIAAEHHVALAWTRAVNSVLTPEINIEILDRKSTESVFDE